MNLDKLMPILYAALNVVSREMVGHIPAVSRNSTTDMAAKGAEVIYPIANKRGTLDIVPGTRPSGSGSDFGNGRVIIDKVKIADPIVWNGEEYKAVGGQYNTMVLDQYAEAIRALVNEVESDLAIQAVIGAIGAGNVYGTAGTTPFAGSLQDMAQVDKIMNDIGAPQANRYFIANTAVAAAMKSLLNLTNTAFAGSDQTLRQGVIGQIMNFNVGVSGGFKMINPGAGSGYLLNGAAAVGATELTIDTGTGAINKGAIITIGSDTNKYVVSEAVPSGGTVLKIAGGLKQAAADNAAITLGSAYLPSTAFSRDAVILATRLPYMPPGGDEAKDVTVLTDPVSGLSIQVAMYGDYRQTRIELGLAWGVASPNAAHSVAILG